MLSKDDDDDCKGPDACAARCEGDGAFRWPFRRGEPDGLMLLKCLIKDVWKKPGELEEGRSWLCFDLLYLRTPSLRVTGSRVI